MPTNFLTLFYFLFKSMRDHKSHRDTNVGSEAKESIFNCDTHRMLFHVDNKFVVVSFFFSFVTQTRRNRKCMFNGFLCFAF